MSNLEVTEEITLETISDAISATTGQPKRLFKVTNRSMRNRTLVTLSGMPADVSMRTTYFPLEG